MRHKWQLQAQLYQLLDQVSPGGICAESPTHPQPPRAGSLCKLFPFFQAQCNHLLYQAYPYCSARRSCLHPTPILPPPALPPPTRWPPPSVLASSDLISLSLSCHKLFNITGARSPHPPSIGPGPLVVLNINFHNWTGYCFSSLYTEKSILHLGILQNHLIWGLPGKTECHFLETNGLLRSN